MSIPKIIHQTFKHNNLPPLYKLCQKEAQTKYPHYIYKFYTDQDMESIIHTLDPIFKKNVFDKLPTKIIKIDLFRYFLLYHFGGVYIDLDYQMINTFDFQQHSIVLPISFGSVSDGNFVLGNCIIASTPNHPFWKSILNSISNSIDNINDEYHKIKNNISKYKHFVLNVSGPKFLTKIYKSHFTSDTSILLPDKNTFHPTQPKNNQEIKNLKLNNAIGFHHCSGSWLKGNEKRI